jgi:hypothetical protein
MPNIYARCKNTAEPTCAALIPTGHYTDLTEEAEIKEVMGAIQPMQLTCPSCRFTATYSREDCGVVRDM